MVTLDSNPPDSSGPRLHLWTALIASALFSLESWALGSSSWIYGYGGGLETIPTYLALSFGDRNFSLWSPFVGGGLPRLAFWGNADPISPEYLLFTFLPTWLAYGLHRYLQYFMAIFFAARVCEEQLGFDARWSAFAGWLHGAFAYLTTGALFTISGVPLLIWLTARIIQPSRGVTAAVLAGLLMSLCTTFTFGVPYLLLFGGAWLILIQKAGTWHAARQFAVFAFTLGIADCPQLLAVMTSASRSHRANWPAEQIEPSLDGLFYRQLQFDMFAQDRFLAFITMNLPGLAFLMGVPLLAATAFWRPDLRAACSRGARVFLLFGLLSQKWLWIVLQAGVSKLFPWVMGVYMGRFFQIPAAFLIAGVLTTVCFLIWQWCPARAFQHGCAAVATAFLAFMIVWPKVALFYPLGIDDWGERNYSVRAITEIRGRQTEPFRVVSVLPLQPAYAYAQGLECADGWANLFPAVYRDLWLRVIDPVMLRLPTVKNIFDPATGKPQDNYIFMGADLIHPGFGALPGEDTTTAVKEGFDIDARFNVNLLRMLNVKYLLSEYPLRGQGIRLVHTPATPPTFPQSRSYCTGLAHGPRPPRMCPAHSPFRGLKNAMSDLAEAQQRKADGKDVFIYELVDSVPRFRFVTHVDVVDGDKAALDLLATFDSARHGSSAVMERQDAECLQGRRDFSPGGVSVSDYSSDLIRLTLDNPGVGALVIANTWDPYWCAEIDGEPRTLFRVNQAQFGIVTRPSDRTLQLRYRPPYSPAYQLTRLGLRQYAR